MEILFFPILLILSHVRSQEVSTRSSLLRPRNHNHHPFDAEQFLKSLKAAPTKQGPVLFPNDAPPPPRPPLVVTSRPLVESIARSELGQPNNTETSQSQLNGQRVSFVPYLARIQDYRPYNPSPTFNYNLAPTQIPYADIVRKSRLNALEGDNRYNDYEEQTILPPIYKALSDHAEQKVLKLKEKPRNYNNFKAPLPDYSQNYQNNNINENSEYDQNQNYAFSYRVNDKKTGDDFSHSQHSSGSATNGEYRVRLPDGRMQIVSYTADENGYKADVRYDDDDDKTAGNKIDNYQQQNHVYNNDYADTYNNRLININSNNNAYENRINNDYVDRNNNVDSNNNYVNSNNNAYENRIHNDYVDRNNNVNENNNYVNSNNNNVYAVKNNVEYTDRSIKNIDKTKTESEYYYPDISKEYVDYSSEYNNYEPHKSKFNFVKNNNANVDNTITVKPSYDELKELFVTKNYGENVAPTSPTPYEGTTEHVVVIGPKNPNLYTNIRNSIPNIASYPTPRVVVATTPQSYLVSTIASLKNKVHLANTPILSDRFIDKINKYLSFN